MSVARAFAGLSKSLTIVLAALCLALLASLAPAVASAETIMVNNTGDAPDANVGTEGCDSIAGGAKQCTLRAAIEESNFSTAVDDNIFFDGSTFLGDPNGNHVTINSNLPPITDTARISGEAFGAVAGKCEVPTKLAGEPIILGPCVQLDRTGPAGPGFVVEADEVEIAGLDIVGMTVAMNVLNESKGFVAAGDWIGLKLSGEPGGNTTGIFLDPNSDEALIGGPNEAENVIAGNTTGVQLQGASEASIEGNYFGVAQDGTSLANNTALDLRITDSTAGSGFPAAENKVGADVGTAAAATPACDGGCNVFGSRAPGSNNIDLNGFSFLEQAPASGPTFFGGNYVGLNAAGNAIESAGFAGTGIFAGGADELQIGGPEPGEANRFTGGDSALVAGPGANDLFVAGNVIGLNAEETETVEPPNAAGLSVDSNAVTAQHTARIVGNTLSLGGGGKGIEQFATGAEIASNRISGGNTGIYVRGESGAGNEIADNGISSTLENGVLIENDENLVVGNKITHAGAAGVRVQNFGSLASTGNTIGGDEVGDENDISESQGNAIEVADEEDDETLIARNNGKKNSGLFIDLGADGPGNLPTGPNGGIQAPAIASATSTAASGTALPGAEVRVFLKTTPEPGEIDGFLGETVADGGGNWTFAYELPLTPGTPIGATQTGLLGTSELAIATTATQPKEEGGGNNGGGNGGGNGGNGKGKGQSKGGKDTTPPQTTIRKGPKRKTHSRTAKFKFVSSEAGSGFQCKLDRRPFKKCRSPKKLTGLKPGKHVFKVRAKDAAGNVDPTPAKRVWRVLP